MPIITPGGGSGGSQPPIHGWFLDYDGTQQTLPHNSSTYDIVWNVEVFDTDGFHSGSDDFVTIPVGLAGWYELILLVITGNSGVGVGETGSRFAYFGKNRPAYDPPMPGYWQQDYLSDDNNISGLVISTVQLSEGDTLVAEMYTSGYTTADIKVSHDPVYHQDTHWVGRYLGPSLA